MGTIMRRDGAETRGGAEGSGHEIRVTYESECFAATRQIYFDPS